MLIGITIAFSLIALACGIALLVWAARNEGPGVNLAKLFGYLISTIAGLIIIISFVFVAIGSVTMGKMMKNCPMCERMKETSNGMKNNSMMNEKEKQ